MTERKRGGEERERERMRDEYIVVKGRGQKERGRTCNGERTAAIESHASGTSVVMFLDTDPFNPLLSHDIARCEENLKIDTHRSCVSLRHSGCRGAFLLPQR